ncbi:peptidyl-prolyl cis-trans isomerase FKBP8-like [Ylistrum balloti]|uniref:peptidyl-prolyl cis-trans isomerase FKBP8-like n=1 Tax=Ylistrum balloti TaxID=509963 RepID=UPI002905D3F6|nr:peptidyl-prolyl cis-trans isomerase FKBP8-like [Ylistrum balloti]
MSKSETEAVSVPQEVHRTPEPTPAEGQAQNVELQATALSNGFHMNTSGDGEVKCQASDEYAKSKCDTDSELTQKELGATKDNTSFEPDSAQRAPTSAEAPSAHVAKATETHQPGEATAAATAQAASAADTQHPEEASAGTSDTHGSEEASASPSVTQGSEEASASPSQTQSSEEASASRSNKAEEQNDAASVRAELEKEKEIDIFGNGLLVKKVIRKGSSDERPNDGDTCTINIEVKLADGTLVDQMEKFSFFLGEHEVMLALDVGIKFMYIGEISVFRTDAKYAYGERGRDPDIPANSSLVLTVELAQVFPGVDRQKLSVDQRLALGEKKRVRGNQLYSWKDYPTAIEVYSRALHILDPQSGSFTEAPEKLQEFLDCRVKCYNNMCICQMMLGHHEAAIKSANEVLNVQPDNWKALSRLGKALGESGDTKKAIEILRRCEKLNKKDKKFQSQNQALMQTYIKKSVKETEKEKKMYKKMFGLQKPATPKVEKKPTSVFAPSWKWALGGVGMALVAVGVTAAFKYFQH